MHALLNRILHAKACLVLLRIVVKGAISGSLARSPWHPLLCDVTNEVPWFRESFRELVVDNSGRLRWNRVENLILESTKSLDYDSTQLWLIVNWVLGEQGQSIRDTAVSEFARLIDAAVAGRV